MKQAIFQHGIQTKGRENGSSFYLGHVCVVTLGCFDRFREELLRALIVLPQVGAQQLRGALLAAYASMPVSIGTHFAQQTRKTQKLTCRDPPHHRAPCLTQALRYHTLLLPRRFPPPSGSERRSDVATCARAHQVCADKFSIACVILESPWHLHCMHKRQKKRQPQPQHIHVR
jgi:hypothetical protein